MNLKICIAGKICSGKSTVARAVAVHTRYPFTSFGDILRKYSVKSGLSASREVLQSLGQDLIDRFGHEGFLKWSIDHSPYIRWDDVLIIDGLRHEVIYRCLVELFPASVLVYCVCDRETQLSRLMNRDKITRTEAEKIISHKTDAYVDELESKAHIVYRPECEISSFLSHLDEFIK